VDLYLIHFPVRLKQDVEGYNIKSEDIIPFVINIMIKMKKHV